MFPRPLPQTGEVDAPRDLDGPRECRSGEEPAKKQSCQSASKSPGSFLSAWKIPSTTDAWISFREKMVATGSRNFDGTLKMAGNGRPYNTIRALPTFRQRMLSTQPNGT